MRVTNDAALHLERATPVDRYPAKFWPKSLAINGHVSMYASDGSRCANYKLIQEPEIPKGAEDVHRSPAV